MVLKEFRKIFADLQIETREFGTREIDLCYSQAMMLQVDEIYKKKHLEMNFVEFIEAISRIADASNLPLKSDNSDSKNLSLRAKLENLMLYLLKLCPKKIKNLYIPPTEEMYESMKLKSE